VSDPEDLAMPDADAFESGSGTYPARRFQAGAASSADEALVEETPVALNYNDRPHAVMMATPTDLEDFAVGFSLTEGIVEGVKEIMAIDVIPSRHGVAIMLRVPEERAARLDSMRRSLPGMGGCGLCGVEDLRAAIRTPRSVARALRVAPAALSAAFASLPGEQPLGMRTGASHAAAFARSDGTLAVVREDAARHNAMDKLVGHLARSGTGTAQGFAVVTSRASYELAQKAATAGFELLAAISAPTGLAVRVACATGLTLVGFARDGRFTCYANDFRLA
jgi:FdhD protein